MSGAQTKVIDLMQALKESLNTTPKDIPVLLKGPLVRAFLAGQKTVTRRTDLDRWRKAKPGDRIWFRETWGYRGGHWCNQKPDEETHFIAYRADDSRRDILRTGTFEERQKGLPRQICRCKPTGDWLLDRERHQDELARYWRSWQPSIFMPKWAARCWAVIEDIREERLQDITPADALREGICPPVGHHHQLDCETPNPVDDFAQLWDSINGGKPGLSWADNPTVARIQFRRIEVPR